MCFGKHVYIVIDNQVSSSLTMRKCNILHSWLSHSILLCLRYEKGKCLRKQSSISISQLVGNTARNDKRRLPWRLLFLFQLCSALTYTQLLTKNEWDAAGLKSFLKLDSFPIFQWKWSVKNYCFPGWGLLQVGGLIDSMKVRRF